MEVFKSASPCGNCSTQDADSLNASKLRCASLAMGPSTICAVWLPPKSEAWGPCRIVLLLTYASHGSGACVYTKDTPATTMC